MAHKPVSLVGFNGFVYGMDRLTALRKIPVSFVLKVTPKSDENGHFRHFSAKGPADSPTTPWSTVVSGQGYVIAAANTLLIRDTEPTNL